jgi:hypothetical protein
MEIPNDLAGRVLRVLQHVIKSERQHFEESLGEDCITHIFEEAFGAAYDLSALCNHVDTRVFGKSVLSQCKIREDLKDKRYLLTVLTLHGEERQMSFLPDVWLTCRSVPEGSEFNGGYYNMMILTDTQYGWVYVNSIDFEFE